MKTLVVSIILFQFFAQLSYAAHQWGNNKIKIDAKNFRLNELRIKYCTNDITKKKIQVEDNISEIFEIEHSHNKDFKKVKDKFDFSELKETKYGAVFFIGSSSPLNLFFYSHCLQPKVNDANNRKYKLDRELKKIYNQIANINGLRSHKSKIGENIYNQGYIVLPKDVEFIYSKADVIQIAEDLKRKTEEEKKIAEKPKKQEPDINHNEKGLKLKQTLLNSNMVMKSKDNIHTLEFKENGTGLWSMGKHRVNIVWEVIDNNTFTAHDPKFNYSRAKINWDNLTLVYEDARGDFWNYDIITPKKLITLIADKPKEKKKPKSTPDDDKIVPAGSGSGFFVSSNGTVITNHHVIEGCKLNKVSHKGSQYEAKVLAVDKVNDIAILKTNITPDRVFPVSNEDVSLLEDVVVAGYPLGKQVSSAIKTHKGVVTALAGAGDNYSNFQTDASINQGNSGGPILDQKGNVVGIAVATWVEEGVQGVHFGIKSSTLKTFASANGLKFLPANNRDLSNKDLGKLIMQSTVYVECHMTIAKIKKMIAEAENKKAFFKEFE